ncbi:contactin-1 isoform X1 [Erpetoichthys calabaricus]|uniref:contactin-1 isoform X1 n=2 Tax=Erpetoichthys calabaricus TaxID=27687 RepID=UPI002234E2C3|nr:contactin-1 isoform X1 [Erpetoichthys calabaricus]
MLKEREPFMLTARASFSRFLKTNLENMLLLSLLFLTFLFSLCQAEDVKGYIPGKGYGPVFEEQPADTIYPIESTDAKISMNCRARGSPPAVYKWTYNGWEIDLTKSNDHYSIIGGNLVINSPEKSRDEGKYQCIAKNVFGNVVSKEATLKFGYLDTFSTEERQIVNYKEGQGAALICDPPDHYPDDLIYRWIFDEFPNFIKMDERMFVSQTTGNLYISKVEVADKGNYSCFVTSPSISKSVFSKYISLTPMVERSVKKYPADIKVKFRELYAFVGQNASLECFALGNPVPEIRWRKVDAPLPSNYEITMSGAVFNIYNVQLEDEGLYECEALNMKGKDLHQARIYVEAFPSWAEHINDTQRDIDSDMSWSCVATGKPKPTIRWLKNGVAYGTGEMKFYKLTLYDAGMYQCIAENRHGSIYANAELKVLASAPDFEMNPVKKKILGAKGGRVVIECKPKAAPKPKFSWSKDTELLHNNSRILIWADGSLEILNVTKLDEGKYTCFAENDRGKANSTGSLSVTDATKITLAPSNSIVNVGQNATMQCYASHDPTLDLTFIWSVNSHIIDFDKESEHYERNLMSESSGKLLIKTAQLWHAGRYTCTAQTIVDNSTASADLVVSGPPGPPGGVRVEEIKDNSVKLSWSRGADNHNPISRYVIESRNMLSEEWKVAKTTPSVIEGNMEFANVSYLIPWMEYEFRVFAVNTLGIGEPSVPSPKVKTLEAAPTVAPSHIGGGGGSNRELTITWMPVPREYHFGSNFGYIVAFKPHGDKEWRKVMVASPDARRYVHKDSTITPSTEFQVKVKAYNNKGEGPYSLTAAIFSAQDAPTEAPLRVNIQTLTSSEAVINWLPVSQQSVDGYQIRYWRTQDTEAAAQLVQVTSQENSTRLENLLPDSHYRLEVRAYNSAGYGPPSIQYDIYTRKAPPSRPPKIISKYIVGSHVSIKWEHVEPLANESKVESYKVLYRQQGQLGGTLYSTGKHFIDIPLHKDGDYIVEVRAHSAGGDGAVAQVRIEGPRGGTACVTPATTTSLLLLVVIAIRCLEL